MTQTFATEIGSGQMTLVKAAISNQIGGGRFYRFGTSVYGTIDPEWADRGKRMGLPCEEIDVEFITAGQLYQQHGVPYFMKVDIEGADMLCIEALRNVPKPRYVSIEAEEQDIERFTRDIRVIADLGYKTFQLVQQEGVPFQRQPNPSREGKQIDHRFAFGSSGLFGKDLSEHCRTLEEVVKQQAPIIRRHNTFGNHGLGRFWISRQILRVLRLYPGVGQRLLSQGLLTVTTDAQSGRERPTIV